MQNHICVCVIQESLFIPQPHFPRADICYGYNAMDGIEDDSIFKLSNTEATSESSSGD